MNLEKAIKETGDGVILKIKVKTNSSRQKFPAGYDEWKGCIVVETPAQPVQGKANKEIVEMARKFFDLKGDEISIAYGNKSSEKGLFLKRARDYVIKKIENEL